MIYPTKSRHSITWIAISPLLHFFIDSSRFSKPKSKLVAEIVNSTESGEEQVNKKHFSKNHHVQVRHVAWIRWKELGSCWSKFNGRRGHKRMKRCCIPIFFSKYCSFLSQLEYFYCIPIFFSKYCPFLSYLEYYFKDLIQQHYATYKQISSSYSYIRRKQEQGFSGWDFALIHGFFNRNEFLDLWISFWINRDI